MDHLSAERNFRFVTTSNLDGKARDKRITVDTMPPAFIDPQDETVMFSSSKASAQETSPRESSPILVLSPSSLSHQPQILESFLSSLPSEQTHDLQMLDRIALNFANLPVSRYAQAVLV